MAVIHVTNDTFEQVPDTALYHRLVCRQAYLHLTP